MKATMFYQMIKGKQGLSVSGIKYEDNSLTWHTLEAKLGNTNNFMPTNLPIYVIPTNVLKDTNYKSSGKKKLRARHGSIFLKSQLPRILI
jgi:hypothetical protein